MSHYSTQLLTRAQTVIPGGVNSPVRAFGGVGGNPIFFKQGKGPYLIDIDNKQYIDYVCSWGPLILGHAHEEVIKSIQNKAALGLSFGAPTELEIELAEFITRYMPAIEKLRLVCSGTEATQSAIRLARGFTGRNNIVKFEGCYHGHVDSLLVKAGSGLLTFGLPDAAGVPESFTQHTLVVPFNDSDALKTVFENFGETIAGVIIEPIACNMNCVLPNKTFLTHLKNLCEQYGSLLIFDEVITGFRADLGGAAALYQIKPDLICLGKIIGGGMPIGAFGGRDDIMQKIAPLGPVYQAGTLSGNPIAVEAGLTTLKELTKPGIFQAIASQTQLLMQGLSKLSNTYSIPLKTVSVGGIFGFFFTELDEIKNYSDVAKSNKEQFKTFFHAMLKEGVYFAPSPFECGFMSSAHTEAIIDLTLYRIEKVFKSWKNPN